MSRPRGKAPLFAWLLFGIILAASVVIPVAEFVAGEGDQGGWWQAASEILAHVLILAFPLAGALKVYRRPVRGAPTVTFGGRSAAIIGKCRQNG